MLDVCCVVIFYAEAVYCQGKFDGFECMSSYAWSMPNWLVAVGCRLFNKYLVGYDARFLKAIHAF